NDLVQHLFGSRAHDDKPAIFRADKVLAYCMVEKFEQAIPVAFSIQQRARLDLDAKLRPGNNFGKLLQRAIAAGQSDERIGKVRHQRFALVHGGHHVQLGHAAMPDLTLHEPFRDDSDGFSRLSSIESAMVPISPTQPPPNTRPMPRWAISSPSFFAASAYA